MPTTRLRYLRVTGLLLLVGLAALLCIVGASIWLVERTDEHLDRIVTARDIRTAAVELRNAMQDIETSQRGYLLTQEEQYLEPYLDARNLVAPLLDQLDTLLERHPRGAVWSRELRANVDRKIEETERTLGMARAGEFEGAVALVDTDAGKAYMEAARDVLDAILQASSAQLSVAVADERGSVEALRWIAVGGALLIMLVVGGAAHAGSQYSRDMLAMREQLESVNARLEERVAARTAQLAAANEEVQRFAYIVTHDLRAPLVNIMGFTSELEAELEPLRDCLEQPDADAPAREAALRSVREDMPEAIGFIRSSTGRMDSLINAILKISRDGRRPLKPEPVDLGEVLGIAVEAVQHQISELDGQIEVQTDLPVVVSDRLAVEQIFGNLLDNAVKYSHPQRPLRVRISGHALPGERYAVDVADNGRGIAQADLERVFELFRKAGERGNAGEGIGLTHVRMLVRNLGGDITLSSQLGEGSTFRVIISRDLGTVLGSKDA